VCWHAKCQRYEILTAEWLKSQVFWEAILCLWTSSSRRFGSLFCLHFYGKAVYTNVERLRRWQQHNPSKLQENTGPESQGHKAEDQEDILISVCNYLLVFKEMYGKTARKIVLWIKLFISIFWIWVFDQYVTLILLCKYTLLLVSVAARSKA
jgi:hypothetical protein